MILTSNNLVAGNLIDSNPTGTAVIGQTENGIVFSGSDNTVGGTVAAARNILPTDGIWLQGAASGNLVEGNILGLDITGAIKLAQYGIGIEADGPNNTIGGTVAGSAEHPRRVGLGRPEPGRHQLYGQPDRGQPGRHGHHRDDFDSQRWLSPVDHGRRHQQHDRRHHTRRRQCAVQQQLWVVDRQLLLRQPGRGELDRHRHHRHTVALRLNGRQYRRRRQHDRRHGRRPRATSSRASSTPAALMRTSAPASGSRARGRLAT